MLMQVESRLTGAPSLVEPSAGGGLVGLPLASATIASGGNVWVADLCRKRLANGNHFMVFNVVDVGTGEWIIGQVRSHFSSTAVIGDLENAGRKYALPDRLLVRNFVCSGRSDLTQWGRTRGVDVVQDAVISSVDGVGLSKKPDGQRFTSLEQVQRSVDKWRRAFSRIERGRLH
jgi:hypothetical protein